MTRRSGRPENHCNGTRTETAAALDGVVVVGDDFAGTCEAYDTKRGWKFGSVGASGEFSENGSEDFIQFLESWYGGPTAV
jgi:hypothetical protein